MRVAKLFPVILMAAACGDSNTVPDARGRADAKTADAPSTIDSRPIDAPAMVDAPVGPTATRVWVTGDLAVDNQLKAGTFLDGATLPVTPTLLPAAGNLAANGKSFDVSADGTKIAYIADSTTTGRFDLYLAGADGSNPVMVFQAPTGVTLSNPQFSPDGTKIAYLADPALATMKDLFFVPATANATPVKLSPDRTANLATLDVFTSLVWSPDSKYIGYSAQLTTAGFDEAMVVDTSAATPVSKFVIPKADIATQASGAQGVRGFAAFDNAGHIYFRARLEAAGGFKLYRANVDGTARTALTLAPARGDASAADFGAFAITPDGTKMVFSADAPTALIYQLYLVTLATPTPLKLTNATVAGTEPAFNNPLMFSPDVSKVAFIADYAVNGDFEPHVAKLDGTEDIRLAKDVVMNGDTEALSWTRDGSAVWMQGDLSVNNETRVYRLSATMADQALTGAIGGIPTGGDVDGTYAVPKP